MTKSSSDSVNAIISPETTPGIIEGSSTFQNACIGVQPRSSAASVRCLSICRSFGMTDRMT